MLLNNLKKEFELRYRIMRYKKYYKWYLYNKFEKNNVELLLKTFEDMVI